MSFQLAPDALGLRDGLISNKPRLNVKGDTLNELRKITKLQMIQLGKEGII